MFNECATSAFQRQGSDQYMSLVIATTSCNRTHSGFFYLQHCYHTFESTCKNKGADKTARALRVVPAFNKVGVLAALNII